MLTWCLSVRSVVCGGCTKCNVFFMLLSSSRFRWFDSRVERKGHVRGLHCHEPIELLYYTAKYDPICTCIYCGQPEPYKNDKDYPQCMSCQDKPSIGRKSGKWTSILYSMQFTIHTHILKNNFWSTYHVTQECTLSHTYINVLQVLYNNSNRGRDQCELRSIVHKWVHSKRGRD